MKGKKYRACVESEDDSHCWHHARRRINHGKFIDIESSEIAQDRCCWCGEWKAVTP